jgi:diguanylate cyclase (GGDEF)-like protein/PAS domain S-box-containing protein
MNTIANLSDKQSILSNDVLESLIADISDARGEEYLSLLVNRVGELIEADYMMVNQLDDERKLAKSFCLWSKNHDIEQMTYPLFGTPCHDLMDSGMLFIPENASQLYPEDKELAELGIEAYLGLLLRDRCGRVLGLMVALFRKPIAEKLDALKNLFIFFHMKVAAELEKALYEDFVPPAPTLPDPLFRVAHQVFDSTQDGIIVTNTENQIIYVNSAFEALCGYSTSDLLGKRPQVLSSGLQSRDFYRRMWSQLEHQGFWQGELWNRHKDGHTYPVLSAINMLRDADGKVVNHVAIHRDLSSEKNAQKLISYQATHDQLTGLYNRYEFFGQTEHQLLNWSAEYPSTMTVVAFLLLDIDHFKSINESFGYMEGDDLLQQVAERLNGELDDLDGALLARFSADQFALFGGFESDAEAVELAVRLLALFKQPFELTNGHVIHMSATVGISAMAPESSDSRELLNCADLALRQARESGRNRYSLFSEELRHKAEREQTLRRRLEVALDAKTIQPYFQPVINLNTGRVSHFEALARWKDSELGVVSPGEFIDTAEQYGLISRLGQQLACQSVRLVQRMNQRLQSRGLLVEPVGVAVNRSVQEFITQDHDSDPLMDAAEHYAMSPDLIDVEVTESLMIDRPEMAKEYLQALKRQGMTLSMDDFGTGYSSLAYLQQFPFDRIKIDRRFIVNIATNPADYTLTKTIIDMAKNLNIKVVAEGVETEQQLNLLRDLGCDYIQGFFYSPALCYRQAVRYLESFEGCSSD